MDHQKRDCAELREAIRRNVVYLDSFMICSNETRKPLRVNFRKGGMKKIVEEEDARHVDAMHYTATVGIWVGRENLKPIEQELDSGRQSLNCEKKGRIHSKYLELVGQNVKRVTGWADPVDNITSFVEVVCNYYEALVDEKRKRAADEDGMSKRANTRSGRKRSKSSRLRGKLANRAQIQVEQLNRHGWKSTISH
jgi:hypothetical protein